MPTVIVPVWEIYCECGWSSVANSYQEAEDFASAHEEVLHLPGQRHPSGGAA